MALHIPGRTIPFILSPVIIQGIGNYKVGLDRGEPGKQRYVKWQRVGDHIDLVQLNTRYMASHGIDGAALDSFAQNVILRERILSEDAEGCYIDIHDLATLDYFHATKLLGASPHAMRLDQERSTLLPSSSYQHRGAIELTARLVFSGELSPDARVVSPDSDSVAIIQRISLLAVPINPMTPRRYHVISGGYGKRFMDISLPLERSQETAWQPRFRLRANRPAELRAAEPDIRFLLDASTPKKWAQPILEGANWWADGFEKIGYPGALSVEIADDTTDLARADVNAIWWVHRSDRGPSFGNALTDPRSGEILRGNVRLGSQRIRQLFHLGEALLSPYGRRDESERLSSITDMVEARLRALAAHEVGHALGFMHNFASQTAAKPSVMDYPFPNLSLDSRGNIDLTGAYSVGLGDWDIFLLEHAYMHYDHATERTKLDELRRRAVEEGAMFLTDADGNPASSCHPEAIPWSSGRDPLATLDLIMSVRAKALKDFSYGAVPPDAQLGELEGRFALLHLLHRYQVAAVVKLIGGIRYSHGSAGAIGSSPSPVSAKEQWAAATSVVKLLHSDVLGVPRAVSSILGSPSPRYERTTGDYASQMGPIFDPIAAVAAATSIVVEPLFEPGRLNRLAYLEETSSGPTVSSLIRSALTACGQRADGSYSPSVSRTARGVIVDCLVNALKAGELHIDAMVSVENSLFSTLDRLDPFLSRLVQQNQGAPVHRFRWSQPVIPQGWPL